jgi:hypothetical protein
MPSPDLHGGPWAASWWPWRGFYWSSPSTKDGATLEELKKFSRIPAFFALDFPHAGNAILPVYEAPRHGNTGRQEECGTYPTGLPRHA